MKPCRTQSGIANEWIFHPIPTVIVEGPSDFVSYLPMSKDICDCRYQYVCGKENVHLLISNLKKYDHPYLVIVDGDYDILMPKRSLHRRVIVLPRYSVENYLWDPDTVNYACLQYAQCGENKDLVGKEMSQMINRLNRHLLPLIILDVAARRMEQRAPKVLPKKIEELMLEKRGLSFSRARLNKISKDATGALNKKMIQRAKHDVSVFLKNRCVSHLVRGKLLLGLIRRVFNQAAEQSARKEGRSFSPINDKNLRLLLSQAIWSTCKDKDHMRLKQKFRKVLRELKHSYSLQ